MIQDETAKVSGREIMDIVAEIEAEVNKIIGSGDVKGEKSPK